MFEDLGSKNGSRVNGQRIQGRVDLSDGDRIRIGAQEMLFLRVRPALNRQRLTGAMMVCLRCQVPFPEGVTACPHCGNPVPLRRPDDETVTGIAGEPRDDWPVQLLSEVLGRAIELGRGEEAEKLLVRFTRDVEMRAARGEAVDPRVVHDLADCAMRHVEAGGSKRWTAWILGIYRNVGRIPPSQIVDRMLALAKAGRPLDLGPIEEYFRRPAGRTLSGDETNALAVLEALRSAMSRH